MIIVLNFGGTVKLFDPAMMVIYRKTSLFFVTIIA